LFFKIAEFILFKLETFLFYTLFGPHKAFLGKHEMIASRRTVVAAIGRSAVQASAVGTQSRSFATLRSGFGSRPAEKSRWGQTEATFQSVLDRFAKVSSLVLTLMQ
jgi:hypothetical protein